MEENLVKPLVIFDMNGIFTNRKYSPSVDVGTVTDENATRLGKFLVWKRAGCDEFLEKVFAHYTVAVWSSVTKHNIEELCRFVFGDRFKDLLFIFNQDDCVEIRNDSGTGELRGDKSYAKPIFLKNLSKVWGCYPQYNENNTLIVDDSTEKMVNNPKQCHVNPGTWDRTVSDGDLLSSVLHVALFGN